MHKLLWALFAASLVGQEFEVASVKPANPRGNISMTLSSGGRLTIRNFTLELLIQEAFSVQRFQVSGGPSWISSEHWDILATAPASSEAAKFVPANPKSHPPPEELIMLQALLADRFQLKIRRDTKEGLAYALVKTNKTLKLNPPKDHADRPLVMLGFSLDADQSRVYHIQGMNATMKLLADKMASSLSRPVTDETGISGNFDFKFEFLQDETNSSLISSIQQLGLKLEARKAPLEMLVIEHAERPSAN